MDTEEDLLEVLKKYFNYTKFKSDIQKNAIKSIVSGKKDVYISMPTGSGKSLCYQLPNLVLENKVTIVISPLIALIKNQVDYLLSRKIRAHTINSTTGSKEKDQILGDLKAKKTETRFLYITPEQAATNAFQDLFKLLVRFQKIAFVAVDEAHCVSCWGHDFRRDYLKLGRWRKEYPSIQWIALTATAPLKVRKDILENLEFKDPAIFQVSCFRNNLYYDIIYKNSMRDDFIELKNYINQCLSKEMADKSLKGSEKPCAIVYCRKKETTESVALGLRKQGLQCKAFHSGLKTSEKEKIQDEWMNGDISVIVATISFGMGIDKAQVRVVVHWDISQNIAAYYQESGRAGRDGKKSYCRLYYCRDEVKTINFILNQDLNKCGKDEKSEKYLRAKNCIKEFGKIVDHCESASCRHLLFTEYFGDPKPKCNDMCDFCKDKNKCIEKLQTFQKLAIGYSTEAKRDEDPSDLYEGGRSYKKGSFDDYSEDSEGGSHRSSEREKKAERSFIDKQFALRKMQAAAAMSMSESTSISRVKHPSSTDTKVSGLTISTREQNLTMLTSVLKNNMEKSALNDPPEYPLHSLIYKDLEDIAVDIEYNCFNSCKAVSIYRRNVAKEIHNIRSSMGLYSATKNHIPAKHKSHGGDYKTIVNDLKDRYGKDVIDELEDEINQKNNKSSSKKSNNKFTSKESNRYDGKTQSKISEFFQNKNSGSNSTVESESSDVIEISSQDENFGPLVIDDAADELDDSEIAKLELKKQDLVSELEQLAETDEKSQDDDDVIEIKDVTKQDKNDFSETVSLENLKLKSNNDFKRRHDEAQCTNNIESKNPPKKPRMESEFRKASDMLTSTTTTMSHPTGLHQATVANADDTEKKRKRNKNKISEIVVNALNIFYHDKKITGKDPKALFKLMARKITHHFYESDADNVPSTKIIRNYVSEVFYNCGVISCEADFKLKENFDDD